MPRLQNATYLVRDLDEGIRFFTEAIGFVVRQDETVNGNWRRVVVGPSEPGAGFVLVPVAESEVGRQAGSDVAFFLETDDFAETHARMLAFGIRFREEPRHEAYGIVAVFEDPAGMAWDLIEPPR